jgi:hypothetical protein
MSPSLGGPLVIDVHVEPSWDAIRLRFSGPIDGPGATACASALSAAMRLGYGTVVLDLQDLERTGASEAAVADGLREALASVDDASSLRMTGCTAGLRALAGELGVAIHD